MIRILKHALIAVMVLAMLFAIVGCGGKSEKSVNSAAANRPEQSTTNDKAEEAPAASTGDSGKSATASDVVDSGSASPMPPDSPASPASSEAESNAFTGVFVIEGKWKSVGDKGNGQAQPGAIVIFDGYNCNFISPKDTYAFYKDGDVYSLDVTTLLGSPSSYTVHIIDENNIRILDTMLKRVS